MAAGGTERTEQKCKQLFTAKDRADFSLTQLPTCKTEIRLQMKKKTKIQSPCYNISNIHHSVKVSVKRREVSV